MVEEEEVEVLVVKKDSFQDLKEFVLMDIDRDVGKIDFVDVKMDDVEYVILDGNDYGILVEKFVKMESENVKVRVFFCLWFQWNGVVIVVCEFEFCKLFFLVS